MRTFKNTGIGEYNSICSKHAVKVVVLVVLGGLIGDEES